MRVVRGSRSVKQGTPVLSFEMESARDVGRLLFIGDVHWDHPSSDRAALRRVLEQAVDANAEIVLLGDLFCAMQGRNDRRGSKASIRPEHRRADYFTALVETAVEWWEPFMDRVWVMLHGNHETAVRKHNEVDLVREFAGRVRDRTGLEVVTPGYSSYAQVRVVRHNQSGGIPFWVGHGTGGAAPVTGGVIRAQRRAVSHPDARFLVSGHIHRHWMTTHPQVRTNSHGRVIKNLQRHYSVGTWKDDSGGDYAEEREFAPTIPSVWWAEFSMNTMKGPRFRLWDQIIDDYEHPMFTNLAGQSL